MHELQWFTDRIGKYIKCTEKVGKPILMTIDDTFHATYLHKTQMVSGWIYED